MVTIGWGNCKNYPHLIDQELLLSLSEERNHKKLSEVIKCTQ